MDSINVDKIQALKKYKQQEFRNSLMFYPLVALICGLFCTSPFWFPPLYSSTKTFLFVSIPKILCLFFNAKTLFILGNLIIVFLLKESKIKSQNSLSPRKFDDVRKIKENSKQKSLPLVEEDTEEMEVMEKCEEEEEEEENVKIESIENEEIFEDSEENEMVGLDCDDLLTEELNKRAEDFIAMVNKQIRLEADHDLVLLCSC